MNVACSAGVFFERAICSRKRHVDTSRRQASMNDPLDKTYSVLIFSVYVLGGTVPERLERWT